MKRITIILLFSATWIVSYSQTPIELLDQYLSTYHTEKIYANHDKPYYIIGETIWCKWAFLVFYPPKKVNIG